MKLFSKLFPDSNKKYLKKIQPLVDEINSLEKEFEKISTKDLKEKARDLKIKAREKSLDEILPEAFALVREAAKRTLGQRHFDVQLMAGIALHQGKIAEMKTGEGKTLAATLPAFLNALTGKGVHVVTVNDYLARRDTVWMGQIYHLLGLSVGCLNHDKSFLYDPEYKKPSDQKDKIRDTLGSFHVVEDFLRECSRREAYEADITYGTNNEFGFDYLRDNMVYDIRDKVQRGFYYAIVDEIDSILIDEARTPLIISQPDLESSRMYKDFARIVPQLKKDEDFEIDEKLKVAVLTERGIDKIEKILGVKDIYQEKGIKYLHHLEQALRAHVFFKRDRDYIVKNGEVIIVDEFTGRLLPGRRYSGGLHQAIEAKEGVPIQPESRTLATITFQNFFRMYEKLSGMTGTAYTSREEFQKVYNLEVICIPTHKPMIRRDWPDKVFRTERGKFKAIVKEVKTRHQRGQPILIGTTSIEKNEHLARLLEREGIRCEVLNAKHHEREGEIIAQAGKKGKVTVATNMAGRGVDIILGGNPPDPKEAQEVRKLGGLFVLGTERHEARRIDDQLRGRAGRQGDPGESQFFISLEDDLLRIFGGERIKNITQALNVPEDQPIESPILSNLIEKAQKRVEGINFDLRSHVLQYDEVVAKHRNRVYSERDRILKMNLAELRSFVSEIIMHEIEKILDQFYSSYHQNLERSQEFNFEELREELSTILPIPFFSLNEPQPKEKLLEFLKTIFERTFSKKEEIEGEEGMERILKFSLLKSLDELWVEHLEMMEYLKDSVKLRAYGGKDPLVEYKTEGHKLFQQFLENFYFRVARTVFKLTTRGE